MFFQYQYLKYINYIVLKSLIFSRIHLFQLYPTSITALVKSNDSPVLVCCESEPDQPIKLRKLLLSHSELNALMSSIVNEVQQCQQALNDENDKRDMYKVRHRFKHTFKSYKTSNSIYAHTLI